MSWQAYVDTSLVGSGNVDKAAIFSAVGDSVWATSPGFKVAPTEMKVITSAFRDQTNVFGTGFKIQGQKYTVIRADSEHLYGRHGKEGAIIVKTVQAILIAHHSESVPSQTAAMTVEGLADYLKGVGY